MRWLLPLLISSAVAHAAPCASESVMAQIHADWGAEPKAILTCRPIRAKHALVLVEARLKNTAAPIYAAVVDPATDGLLWTRDGVPGTPGSTYAVSIVDLDADGTDELVVREIHEGHMGSGSDTLHAYAVRGTELVEAGTLVIGQNGFDGANGCTGSWAVVGGRGNRPRIQITAERMADPKRAPAPESCPPEGVHRHRWTGTAFALAD